MIEPHELGQPIARLCRVWSPLRCDAPAMRSGGGFELPFCEYHLRVLPREMFDLLVLHSTVSPWDMAGLARAQGHLRACLFTIRRLTTGNP